MRLVVVGHVVHYAHDDRVWAYAPYAKELAVWADLFADVAIAAPLRISPPPADCEALPRNVRVIPQRETGGTTARAKVQQIAALPQLVASLWRAMRDTDAIHVRCPGNLGMLGAVLAPLASPRVVAKFAGQWNDYPGEATTTRLQKLILRRWFSGPVTVYGDWPGEPPHVTPFFTSVMTRAQVARAAEAAVAPRARDRLRVLYVGRLSAEKHVDTLLDALTQVRTRGVACTCTIVGVGPEQSRIAARAAAIGGVELAGGHAHADVLAFYRDADALVLVSETEGWPKVIAEAMAHGVVCVGARRGIVPQLLGDGRGYVVEPGDVSALAARLISIAAEDHTAMRARAAAWAGQFSIEGLREAIARLLERAWKVELPR